VQHSNGYIIGFIIALTIACGSLLALANVFLKPFQKEAQELDTKKQILSAVVSDMTTITDVNDYYAKRIEAIAVDVNGDLIAQDRDGSDLIVENINIAKEFKEKDKSKKRFPVFKYKNDKGDIEAYILPVYGNGLWDNIWGYVALNPDLATLKGVALDHKGETPGLGARITDAEVQNRYQGKSIYDEAGVLVGVTMIKGEKNPPEKISQNQVDGMAGATITAVGVNDMVKNYLGHYQNYFEKEKKNSGKKAIELKVEEVSIVTDSLQVEGVSADTSNVVEATQE
jgi:Na+-transporting NADH:ubiquinone oxidoreductase subunit C